MRTPALALLIALALPAAAAEPFHQVAAEHNSPTAQNGGKGWRDITVETAAVPLNGPDSPAPGVAFMGALVLTSKTIDRVHGLSDLKFTSARDFLSVSDEGWMLSGRVVLDEAGRLAGVEKPRMAPLLGEVGDRLFDRPRRKEDNYDTWADSEGLAVLSSGRYLVSFEHHQRVWMYGVDKRGDDLPRAMISPPFPINFNDGVEALTGDGRGGYYAAAESGGVWHCAVDRCTPIADQPEPPLTSSAGLRVTSLERDPRGRGLFVLERAFNSTTGANIMRVSLWADPDRGGFERRKTLFELTNPMTVDNMEGIAAVKHGKATRLYIVSDDNFRANQRTLLMAFDYTP